MIIVITKVQSHYKHRSFVRQQLIENYYQYLFNDQEMNEKSNISFEKVHVFERKMNRSLHIVLIILNFQTFLEIF